MSDHHANRAEEWPPTWTPRRRLDWTRRGGTVAIAESFWEAGWDAPAVLAATYNVRNVAELIPPSGPSWVHRALGDDLGDLLEHGAPDLSEYAELVCSRRHPDGRHQVLELRWLRGSLTVQRHEQQADGWHGETLATEYPDLAHALETVPDLREVGGSVVVQFFVNGEPDARRLAEHLVVTAATESDVWPPEIAEEWLDEDEQLAEDMPDVTLVPVWGRISWLTATPEEEHSYRVAAVEVEVDSQSVTVPALIDNLPQIVGVETLAESRWFSESGGAPISWDGGNRLIRLQDNVFADDQSGDLGRVVEVWKAGEQQSVASLIAAWALGHDLAKIAALHLEPVDPDGLLSPDDRTTWQELIGLVHEQTSFDVHGGNRDEVRAELGRSDEYAGVARALREPAGGEGQALRAQLEELASSGALGSLISGDLENEPSEWEEDEDEWGDNEG